MCILVFSFSFHGQSGPRFSQVSYSVSLSLSLLQSHLPPKRKLLFPTQNTSDPRCVGLFHTSQFSGHQLGVLQFSFNTNYLGRAQTLRVKGMVPQIAPTPGTRCKSQIVTCTSSDQPAISHGSHNPLLSFGNLL